MPAAQDLEPAEIAELIGQRLQVVAVERERREHGQPAERGRQLLELIVGEVAHAPKKGENMATGSTFAKGPPVSCVRVASAPAPRNRCTLRIPSGW